MKHSRASTKIISTKLRNYQENGRKWFFFFNFCRKLLKKSQSGIELIISSHEKRKTWQMASSVIKKIEQSRASTKIMTQSRNYQKNWKKKNDFWPKDFFHCSSHSQIFNFCRKSLVKSQNRKITKFCGRKFCYHLKLIIAEFKDSFLRILFQFFFCNEFFLQYFFHRATTEFTGWPTPSTTPISIEKLLEAARTATVSSINVSMVTMTQTSSTTSTSTTTTTTQRPTTPGICEEECEVAGTIKIIGNATWVPELLDRNTKEWQLLAEEIEQEVLHLLCFFLLLQNQWCALVEILIFKKLIKFIPSFDACGQA